ncbi:cytidine deaminase [Carboxylicivirga sp. A043]|uniref:cytidine deaminase n=1 Tax=Carboxylicivirga litoralis TaxID=2816963 RepID=UPI0021CB114B|nr:cytidine deaminase [Carboxylicivirga sp. A043]MCU4156098.1 cytidine deaminase [Carboxylicivirga sp. A043]
MKKLNLTTSIDVFESSEELSQQEQILLQKAEEACNKAYAPYSEFYVGAAVLLENGEIITGSNQENAAYPSGLCAERTAIFYANAQYPDSPVVSIAIIARNKNGVLDNPVAPCGACRQVMLETELRFKKAYDILLVGHSSIQKIKSSKDLLPLSFVGEGLIKKADS